MKGFNFKILKMTKLLNHVKIKSYIGDVASNLREVMYSIYDFAAGA